MYNGNHTDELQPAHIPPLTTDQIADLSRTIGPANIAHDVIYIRDTNADHERSLNKNSHQSAPGINIDLEQDCNTKPIVLHLHDPDWSCAFPDYITKTHDTVPAVFETCWNWKNLIERINLSHRPPQLITLCLSAFTDSGMSLSEIMNMMVTLKKFLISDVDLKFAVILTNRCDRKIIRELRQHHIQGVIPFGPEFDLSQTAQAYDALLAGQPHWPDDVIDARRIFAQVKVSGGISLTERQRQVCDLVCNRGLSNKSIARMLSISESTVKIHVSAILKSYGVNNRTQLALAAKQVFHA